MIPLRKLASYLKPYWKATLLAPLLMVVEVFMDLLQPRLMARIVDDGVIGGDFDRLKTAGLYMLITSLIGLAGGVGCCIYANIAAYSFGKDVRDALFRKVQTFSYRNLEEMKTGSLIVRLTNDVTQVQQFIQLLLRGIVRSPLLAAGSLIMAFSINVKLAWILVVVTPLLAGVVYFIITKGFPLFSQVQAKLDKLNAVLQENLAGIRVVKAFVRSDYERKRFNAANEEYRDVATQANVVMASMSPAMFLLLNGTTVAVLWFGGGQYWGGTLKVGDLAAFINYVTQMLSSMLMVGMMLMNVSRAKASADRINGVMAVEPEITSGIGQNTAGPAPRTGMPQPAVTEGRIEFDRVSFSYGGEDEALRDITFTVEPGQTVAILGATGAGKSTLVNLIPRLYEATSGSVRLDGTDVREMDLAGLRSRIGTVLQEAVLFSGTIRDNIRYGKPEATQEEVEAAAMAAQAHDFITAMPEGYDTRLGQRGINLSGGQKQRLSIARALLLRPPVLLFDDSTSAVDLGTESRIRKALRELMGISTCLIVAQRISSVLTADKILVLEDGCIAASGTHAELMATSEVYRDICRSQLREEDMSRVG